ncbi:MAG: helix-turn-helix domain-containing protein [Proteobacteria bacterium]|nr:helix-turn-helix domain-containing protein [Pseudomonadota bacterium]
MSEFCSLSPNNNRPKVIESIKITWLTYQQAAKYTGWTVRYLRNLVSSDQIPVYGPQRSRRFRVDMLDLFLTNRDAAMRKFQLERNAHGD